MTVYYIMLLILIFFINRESNATKIAAKRTYLILALIPIFVLIAFKDGSVGSDTSNYLHMFDVISSFNNFDMVRHDETLDIEYGYKYATYLLSRVFSDAHVVLYFLGGFVCISLYSFITKTASNYCLALYFFVTLGFFQFAMTGVRQTIAICIALYGYNFIRQRKLVRFILVVLLAMTFHKSAIVVIPTYFIANLKISAKNISLLTVGMFILLSIADKLLLTAAEVMEYNYGIEETGNGYIFLGIVILITILCLSRKKILLQLNPANAILLNINFISMAMWCVRLISRTVERVSLYFMPYTYVALEEYIISKRGSERTIYLLASIVLAGFLCLYRLSGQPELNDFKFYIQ